MIPVVLLTLPLVAAVVSALFERGSARLTIARLASAGLLVTSSIAALSAGRGSTMVVEFGGWSAPLGISFRVDRVSALFLVLLSLVLVATFASLSRHTEDRRLRRIATAALFLATGLVGAFVTSDLFNLFVMFELVLVSSYLLLQASGPTARRAAAPYVLMNVVASVLFFVGAGLLYALGGSLSLPHLSEALAGIESPWRAAGVGLLTLAFSTKAGLVPFMFWLPRTYPALHGPVAALFAGMMTKLGVYALIRISPLLAGTALPELLLWLGSLSALLAVLAAQAQSRLRDLLGFHVVSQVGFMVASLGLATVAGLAGAVLYVAHHVLVKTCLFLIADVAEPETTPGADDRSRPSDRPHPGRWLTLAFALAGLSLAGLPPLSGFVGKVAVFQALVASARGVAVVLLLVASLGTLVSVLKMWARVSVARSAADGRPRASLGIGLLAAASLLLVVFAGPAHRFALEAAEQVLSAPQRSMETGS